MRGACNLNRDPRAKVAPTHLRARARDNRPVFVIEAIELIIGRPGVHGRKFVENSMGKRWTGKRDRLRFSTAARFRITAR